MSSVVHQPDGLGVAHPERHQRQHLVTERHVLLREALGLSHGGAEHGPSLLVARHQVQALGAGVGVDVEGGADRRCLLVRQQRRETTNAVAGDLGNRPVGVVQSHAGAAGAALEQDQAVCADSGRAGAHVAGECGEIAADDVGEGCVQEIVAVRVGFPEVHGRGSVGNREPGTGNCVGIARRLGA